MFEEKITGFTFVTAFRYFPIIFITSTVARKFAVLISFSTAVVFESSTSLEFGATFDSTNNKVVIS